MPFRKTLTTTTAAMALALAAAPLMAIATQPAAAQEMGDYATGGAADYSSAELDAFTTALMEVSVVREKYSPMLQSAQTEEQQAAIIEEANAEMMEAIEATDGMTMESYLEIAQAASEDEALNDRIVSRLQEHSNIVE